MDIQGKASKLRDELIQIKPNFSFLYVMINHHIHVIT